MSSTFEATFVYGQSLRVKWGNTVSSEFTVSNGVKQGGVLSPILFAIYIQMDC